ncbi:expansin-A13 isoform X2 [Spinacia oleracea]|uniref:Expansin-A13 isoform X2 n=1 Tax=Spinacia oleracea TaxID=3562 RepID=A0ABM3QGQ8_SPIOL|nr:expansin-A13 isoform X2 [Spinacia oleracea]
MPLHSLLPLITTTHTLFLIFSLLRSPTFSTAHYNPSPSTPSPLISEWESARATYYAGTNPRDIVGGACGYGDLDKAGYGKATVGLSTALFSKGQICGACYEVRCVEDLRNCIPAFEKIALWKAGNMAIQYRRMRCRKEGGIRFAIDGSGVFISVLVSNVAGAGDVVGLKVKGSQTGWLPMSRNWGQNWILNANLKNQPLSFEVTTSDGAILMSYNVAPKSWKIGQTFDGKQFD